MSIIVQNPVVETKVIIGDISIAAGDIIECKFKPEVNAGTVITGKFNRVSCRPKNRYLLYIKETMTGMLIDFPLENLESIAVYDK